MQQQMREHNKNTPTHKDIMLLEVWFWVFVYFTRFTSQQVTTHPLNQRFITLPSVCRYQTLKVTILVVWDVTDHPPNRPNMLKERHDFNIKLINKSCVHVYMHVYWDKDYSLIKPICI